MIVVLIISAVGLFVSSCSSRRGPIDGGPCSYKTVTQQYVLIGIDSSDSNLHRMSFQLANTILIDEVQFDVTLPDFYDFLADEWDILEIDSLSRSETTFEITTKEIIEGSCSPFITTSMKVVK